MSSTPCLSRDNSRASGGAAIHQHSMLVQTSFDSHRDSSKALGPHITVINHDGDKPPGGAAAALRAGPNGSRAFPSSVISAKSVRAEGKISGEVVGVYNGAGY